jgi:hypothetical protein
VDHEEDDHDHLYGDDAEEEEEEDRHEEGEDHDDDNDQVTVGILFDRIAVTDAGVVGVDEIDLGACVAVGGEGDTLAVGRPCGSPDGVLVCELIEGAGVEAEMRMRKD